MKLSLKCRFVLLFVLVLLCTAPASADLSCVTKGGYLFTHTEADLDLVTDLLTSGDKVAVGNMAGQGRVMVLKPGLRVYMKSGGLFSGKCQIRPEGMTTYVWTYIEAVDCK